MTRRHLLLAAALALGLAGGSVAAIVARSGPGAPVSTMPASGGAAIAMAPALPKHDRLPDGRFDPAVSHVVVDAPTVRLAAQVPGSGGAPGWAVRTFRAERRSLRAPARTLDRPVWRMRVVCTELLRTYRGSEGWLYPDNRFRPIAPGAPLLTSACASTRPARETAELVTRAAPDPRGEWIPDSSVVWGVAPAGARRATVEGLAGGRRSARIGPHGAFLIPVPDAASPRGAAVVYALRDGGTARVRLSSVARAVRSKRGPVPGTEQLEALTPDPAGGPSLGFLVADRGDGGTCVGGAAQAVGNRIGLVETSLGLFYEGGLRRADCRPPRVPPTRTLPVVSGMGFSSGHSGEDDLFLRRARIERRLQRGRLEISAICHPDVERVTIQTPRDVRTLVPSPRARAILAVYAGNFRAGEIVITAHLRGGRTWTERYPLGF